MYFFHLYSNRKSSLSAVADATLRYAASVLHSFIRFLLNQYHMDSVLDDHKASRAV